MAKNKNRKKWTRKDDLELIKLFNEGKSTKFVSEYFNISDASALTRKSVFARAGLIKGDSVALNPNFDIEVTKEMKDSVRRFGKLSEIPEEWIFDWSERVDGNIYSTIRQLEKLYNEERK